MGDSTTVRVDRATHDTLKRLARERGDSVTDTVARAVRLLKQEHMGRELSQDLTDEESEWLNAELG